MRFLTKFQPVQNIKPIVTLDLETYLIDDSGKQGLASVSVCSGYDMSASMFFKYPINGKPDDIKNYGLMFSVILRKHLNGARVVVFSHKRNTK